MGQIINHQLCYHSQVYMSNLWKTITQGKIWKGELKIKSKEMEPTIGSTPTITLLS
jgi:hypothetical protein